MSYLRRIKDMSNNRCPSCGARMRLVKVVRVNSFPTPEAKQYDLSVSRRKGLFESKKTTVEELRCACCSYSMPAGSKVKIAAPVEKKEKPEKEVKAKKEKVKTPAAKETKPTVSKAEKKQAKKERRNERRLKRIANKSRRVFITKLVIFLLIAGVAAYFIYKYFNEIVDFYNQVLAFIDKAREIIDKVKAFIDQAKQFTA